MPACVTHYIHAREIKKYIEENNILPELNPDAYFWGAQGPDFLFCDRDIVFKHAKVTSGYANKMHEGKPSPVFNAIRNFLSKNNNNIYKSYALGFICHYSLDSVAHPYVNAFAKELLLDRPYETQSTLHIEIEAAIDTIMLRRYTGKLPSEINLGKFFPKNKLVQIAIAKLYKSIILDVYGEVISEERLIQCTNDAHLVFSLLTDKTTLKHKIFNRIEKNKPHLISSHILPVTENPYIDYANITKSEWEHNDIIHNESFFELYDKAIERAKIIIPVADICEFSEITEEIPFF